MIQPDIDPAREPLMPEGILRVPESLRGVLGHGHRVLSGGAAEEALAILLGPCGGRSWGSPLRVRNPIRAAGSCGRAGRHTAGRMASAARRAGAPRRSCIRACAEIRSRLRMARRIRAGIPCGATGARSA